MKHILRPALVLFGILTLITGVIYPLVVTGFAQTLFPQQANGSLITRGTTVVGSSLIGQSFDAPQYFWGRLSATGSEAYNATASGGSNMGVLNPALAQAAQARIDALKAADPSNTAPIPVDLITASASGLDPQISPAAAYYQAARVATARGISVESVNNLIAEHTDYRTVGVLGEPRVNVLPLNLALDAITQP